MIKRRNRFLNDRRGLAAVEFALIAPMMVMLLLGSVEIVNILQTNRRVENVSASLADVVSRDTDVTNAEMNGLWSALTPLMFPNTTGTLDVRITSIRIISASEARVVWHERRGTHFGTLASNELVSGLPNGMMLPGTSVIRVETAYNYQPTIGFWFLGERRGIEQDTRARELEHVAFRRSRLVDPITRST